MSFRRALSRVNGMVLVPRTVTLLLTLATTVQTVNALSIDEFEKSAVFVKYTLQSKDRWTLKTGGVNFYYVFRDPESQEGVIVELSSDPKKITQLAISWNGRSTLQPATLTQGRERFLRDVVRSCFPDVSPQAVVQLVGSEQKKNYPGGSDAMPRRRLGALSVYAGTVGNSLVVGIRQ